MRSPFVQHPQYNAVLALYTQEFIKSGGRLNEKKFYEKHIGPIAPTFKLRSWYQMIERFRKKSGLVADQAIAAISAAPAVVEEGRLENAMMSNDAATQLGIRAALNIGARALQEVIDKPEILLTMSTKERAEFLFKAMKSQDSRIHAIGKVREDSRDQAKFDQAFGGAAME